MSIDAFATPLDLAALAYFLLAIGIYRLVAGARWLESRSLIGAVQAQRVRWMLNMAKRDNLTLRQVAMRSAAGKDHWTLIGTPQTIADELERWFVEKAADGFNLLPPHVPGAINEFVDRVVSELQRRGLFRTDYEGATLRENLGVPFPN